jgi:hypothetical protein
MKTPIIFEVANHNDQVFRRFLTSCVQLTSACLLLFFLTACDDCTADTDLIKSHARILNENAIEATNIFLYINMIPDLQMKELKILREVYDAAQSASSASQSRSFLDLRTPLADQLATLEILSPSMKNEIGAAISRSSTRATEVLTSLIREKSSLANDQQAFGACIASFEAGFRSLDVALDQLADALSEVAQYLKSRDALIFAVRGQVREIDNMSGNTSLQADVATIARLMSFNNEMLNSLTAISTAEEKQVEATNAGLENVLQTFKRLQRVADLPPDLEKETQDAVKLLEDVKTGHSYSVK